MVGVEQRASVTIMEPVMGWMVDGWTHCSDPFTYPAHYQGALVECWAAFRRLAISRRRWIPHQYADPGPRLVEGPRRHQSTRSSTP
jgi:hypothetical protein